MGEPLLVMTSEWTAEGVPPHLQEARSFSCDERNFSSVCAELRAGRSVCLSPAEIHAEQGSSGIEGIGTRTKAIVPIFVASEFIGVVSLDRKSTRLKSSHQIISYSAFRMNKTTMSHYA